jgi:hypothetical protein
MDQKQSDAIVESQAALVAEVAVTKADLGNLRRDVGADLAAIESRWDRKFDGLGHKIEQLKWINLTVLSLGGAAAIKYLFNL